jgi:hypothetical protein
VTISAVVTDKKQAVMNMGDFTKTEIEQIEDRGYSIETICEQIKVLRNGIPSITLNRPCLINEGIFSIPPEEFEHLYEFFKKATKIGRLSMFIPASGAACRMFKPLTEILKNGKDVCWDDLVNASDKEDETSSFALEFFQNIESFAFFDDLVAKLCQRGIELPSEGSVASILPVLDVLLTSKGLDFANLPKGMIPFHLNKDNTRTPFEEYIIAAKEITRDSNGLVHIHFTIPESGLDQISNLIDGFLVSINDSNVKFDITYSFQKPSTDTIAIDHSDKLLKDLNGQIVFRPGGHGALIENLNDLDGDIVMIKNIDNILPEVFHDEVLLFEKLICGFYLTLETKLFQLLHQLDDEGAHTNLFDSICKFIKDNLMMKVPAEWNVLSTVEKTTRISRFLNRPLRVCGVVKNTGAPGGGPFWVSDKYGESKQIVETAQVDRESDKQMNIWQSSTHFNPVDMVSGLKDYRGKKFNLLDFIDKKTGFTTKKIFHGQEIKALELPGLWNGSMAGWLTVFVDVPLFTFNPVKTVNDLLKNKHLIS